MAALLPILQEILPMLMPGPVQIVRAEDVGREEGEDEGEKDRDGREGRGEEEQDGRREDGRREDGRREGEQDGEQDGTAQRPAKQGRRRPPPGGVSLRDAVVHKSSALCASVLTVQPGCATVVFHNGEQEALVYAVSGSAVLATLPDDGAGDDDDEDDDDADDADDDGHNGHDGHDGHGDDASRSSRAADPTSHAVRPGDFALIPAWTEHQVRNVGVAGPDGRPPADVVWVVVRNGAEPTVVPLRAWGGEQMEA